MGTPDPVSPAGLAAWLELLLELDRFPVGIRLLASREEYLKSEAMESPAGLPYCGAVSRASRGQSLKMSPENSGCAAGARALGMEETPEEVSSGRRHRDLGVYRDLEVSAAVARDMVYLSRRTAGVELRPLGEHPEPPDVVLVVTTPYNAMRILQGYAYHRGQLKEMKMTGMCAICQECTSFPLEKDTVNLSMLCSGTRCVGRWGKEEMAVGIPWRYMAEIVDGLRLTAGPMEPDPDKERIRIRLEECGVEEKVDLPGSHNYYTGAYGTREQLNRRKNRKTGP